MNDQRFLDQALVSSRVRVPALMGPIVPAGSAVAYADPATTTKPNVWLGGVECGQGRTFHNGTGRLTPDDLGRST